MSGKITSLKCRLFQEEGVVEHTMQIIASDGTTTKHIAARLKDGMISGKDVVAGLETLARNMRLSPSEGR